MPWHPYKVTEELVRRAKQLRENGGTYRRIAKELKISKGTVEKIFAGLYDAVNWARLAEPPPDPDRRLPPGRCPLCGCRGYVDPDKNRQL